jgi:signal transduction histidine kinase
LDSVTMDVSDEVDLNEIAANTVAAMAPWAVAQERAIIFDGLDRQVLVTGNGHAIEDALRNLIENAILHSPPRTEIIVRVSSERSISVVDAGPGISPGDRELIFERFWRGKGVASGGAGLGLSIVREIMNAHRASISVEANPNGGAVFTLQFPRAAGPESSTQSI